MLMLNACHAGAYMLILRFGIKFSKKENVSPLTCQKWVSLGERCHRQEVACLPSDRQGANFGSFVWREVSYHSSHYPQEVLLVQFSLYVHKCGLNRHVAKRRGHAGPAFTTLAQHWFESCFYFQVVIWMPRVALLLGILRKNNQTHGSMQLHSSAKPSGSNCLFYK